MEITTKQKTVYTVGSKEFESETEATLYAQELEKREVEKKKEEERKAKQVSAKKEVDDAFDNFTKARKEWLNKAAEYNKNYPASFPYLLNVLTF